MRHRLLALSKYALVSALATMSILAVAGTASQVWVIRAARPFTYSGIDEVPARDLALVPGVGSARPGRPPRNLSERLRVALALYRAHKVEAILISGIGDGSVWDEMVEMRRWLGARGVPPERILSDPGGYRTFDTMWRAANVLHVSGVIVCTQVANMTRSLFLARTAGIDAVGLIAPSSTSPTVYGWRQDALKTVLAIADTYILHPQPRISDARGISDGRSLDVARFD
jgi:SanA protein